MSMCVHTIQHIIGYSRRSVLNKAVCVWSYVQCLFLSMQLRKIFRKTESTALSLFSLLSQQKSLGSNPLIKNNTDNAVLTTAVSERIK